MRSRSSTDAAASAATRASPARPPSMAAKTSAMAPGRRPAVGRGSGEGWREECRRSAPTTDAHSPLPDRPPRPPRAVDRSRASCRARARGPQPRRASVESPRAPALARHALGGQGAPPRWRENDVMPSPRRGAGRRPHRGAVPDARHRPPSIPAPPRAPGQADAAPRPGRLASKAGVRRVERERGRERAAARVPRPTHPLHRSRRATCRTPSSTAPPAPARRPLSKPPCASCSAPAPSGSKWRRRRGRSRRRRAPSTSN